MLVVKFSGKIWNTGNAHVITIPSDYVKHGLIRKGVEYQITIKVCDTNDRNKKVNKDDSIK